MPMKILRVVAILQGVSLMLGEAYRSWGADRPVMFWMDDQIMGVLLISSAILMARDTFHRRAYFAAAWGFSAGMNYGSFFAKIYEPGEANAGNFDLGLLTFLIGLAFVVACVGMAASIMLPREESIGQ